MVQKPLHDGMPGCPGHKVTGIHAAGLDLDWVTEERVRPLRQFREDCDAPAFDQPADLCFPSMEGLHRINEDRIKEIPHKRLDNAAESGGQLFRAPSGFT